MKTICVAIPCYKPHIPKLYRLLESIQAQTLLPHQVVISCSSMGSDTFPTLPPYSFSVTVLVHSGRKNAAENRNYAALHNCCDILSFMDCDDIMHPQRLEFIEKALRDSEFVVHNYIFKDKLDIEWTVYEAPDIESNCIGPVNKTAIRHLHDKPVHASQCSIRAHVFEKVNFDESRDLERREDSLFCYKVLQEGFKAVYVAQALGKYDEAGMWFS